jgi:hypothetical protein
MAAERSRTLNAGIFTGIAFFAAHRIYNNNDQGNNEKHFVHVHGFTTVKIKTHLMRASLGKQPGFARRHGENSREIHFL